MSLALLPSVPPTRSRKAFSLLELLAVMGIMVVLTSLVMPSIGNLSKGRLLNDGVDRAWSALSAARQEAIARQVPVALVMSNNRQTAAGGKSDGIVLLAARSVQDATGAVTWQWTPAGAWTKIPAGVAIQANSGSFYAPYAAGSGSTYSQITAAVPILEGDSITDYSFIVFRTDGSVDAPSNNPFLGFKRLNAGVTTNEFALVISPDSGRTRIVQYSK